MTLYEFTNLFRQSSFHFEFKDKNYLFQKDMERRFIITDLEEHCTIETELIDLTQFNVQGFYIDLFGDMVVKVTSEIYNLL